MQFFPISFNLLKRNLHINKTKAENVFDIFSKYNSFNIVHEENEYVINILFTPNVNECIKNELYNFIKAIFSYRLDIKFITEIIDNKYGLKIKLKKEETNNLYNLYIGEIDF